MGTVGIADLKTGMELKAPLHSKQGRQLMPSGTLLTDNHINTLKVWGIIEADIVGEGENENAKKSLDELPKELVELTKHHTRLQFKHADAKHPAVRSLARLTLNRVANELVLQNNWEKAFTPPRPPVFAEKRSTVPSVKEIIESDIQLASLPEVFHQIIEAINDPRTSATHIADIVSKDTSLSAKLLRIVNSPYYGFAEKVDTLSRALALVGMDKLTDLALGISAVSAFKEIDEQLFDMREFWEHSIRCALASSWLASQTETEKEETYFLAGLLHDIGWLIMLKLYPDQAREALIKRKFDPRPSYLVEKDIWGFDHAELGGMALKAWQLPDSIVNGVMHHHAPHLVKYEHTSSIIHISDFVSHALNTKVRFEPMPPMRGGAWSALGLTHNVFAPMATQIDAQLQEILGVFFSG